MYSSLCKSPLLSNGSVPTTGEPFDCPARLESCIELCNTLAYKSRCQEANFGRLEQIRIFQCNDPGGLSDSKAV